MVFGPSGPPRIYDALTKVPPSGDESERNDDYAYSSRCWVIVQWLVVVVVVVVGRKKPTYLWLMSATPMLYQICIHIPSAIRKKATLAKTATAHYHTV